MFGNGWIIRILKEGDGSPFAAALGTTTMTICVVRPASSSFPGFGSITMWGFALSAASRKTETLTICPSETLEGSDDGEESDEEKK